MVQIVQKFFERFTCVRVFWLFFKKTFFYFKVFYQKLRSYPVLCSFIHYSFYFILCMFLGMDVSYCMDYENLPRGVINVLRQRHHRQGTLALSTGELYEQYGRSHYVDTRPVQDYTIYSIEQLLGTECSVYTPEGRTVLVNMFFINPNPADNRRCVWERLGGSALIHEDWRPYIGWRPRRPGWQFPEEWTHGLQRPYSSCRRITS